MYNDYMYAVDRSDEYLAHYGIKGMKWGVQKAIASGNSNKLARQYKKAQKKLAKLEKRANNGSKYAKRAAALGAGAALAGGAAALGTGGISRGIAKVGGVAMKGSTALGGATKAVGKGLHMGLARVGLGSTGNRLHKAMDRAGDSMLAAGQRGSQMHRDIAGVSKAVNDWGNKTQDVGKGVHSMLGKAGLGQQGNQLHKAMNASGTSQISNNTIARVGAGALGAGLAAGAAYNAYRAATTKKAAAKAQQFRSEMNKAFAGTKYANGGNGSSGGSKKRRRR